MIVLIPAYEPDRRLPALVASLLAQDPELHVVVVDDGSGLGAADVFGEVRALGAQVIQHSPNQGKGYALKQGFAFIHREFPGEPVACADCDGQHSPVDVMRVLHELSIGSEDIVLGVREFSGEVPLRSRIGNDLTRRLFGAVTRRVLGDTQTGLRGYAPELLPWLETVAGDRFEYELAVLLEATRLRIPIREVGINTIYLEHNATSHFRPVQDSIRVMLPLGKFAGSSFLAFCLDTVTLLALHRATGSIVFSAVAARALSSALNFATNRNLVFSDRRDKHIGAEAAQYWALVAALLTVNVALLSVLTQIGLSLFSAKMVTEIGLFIASFRIQRRFVFARPRNRAASD
jgi:glycosyltransferase involved in cell wall biosynthesis